MLTEDIPFMDRSKAIFECVFVFVNFTDRQSTLSMISEARTKASQHAHCDSVTASGCDSPAKRLRCSHDASVEPVDSMNSSSILCIPDEVVHIIVAELPAAADVRALSSTCKGLNRSINGDPQQPDYGCLAAAAWLWRWRREDCLLLAARCRCRSETEAFIIELLKRLMKLDRAETAVAAVTAVAAAEAAAVLEPVVVAAGPELVAAAAAVAPGGLYDEDDFVDAWSEDEEPGGSEDEGQAAGGHPQAGEGRDTVLHIAADRGHSKLLTFLLSPLHDDGGGCQELLNATDASGSTPLILACMNGHVEAARQLLDHPGIQINATDGDGKVGSCSCEQCTDIQEDCSNVSPMSPSILNIAMPTHPLLPRRADGLILGDPRVPCGCHGPAPEPARRRRRCGGRSEAHVPLLRLLHCHHRSAPVSPGAPSQHAGP